MRESSYPKPVGDVVRTLTEICRHQKNYQLVEMLENSHSYFDEINFDNWNGGTTTWALRLEVPTPLFALAQSRLSEIEKDLGQKIEFLDRLHPNDPIGEVTITPLTSAEIPLGQRMAPSDVEERRLWREGYFRLFLSHVSHHKVHVAQLKTVLLSNGVSAFVAHEDIEPSLEWQDEISLALRSMHALAALITPDFHSSKWTDQEVGWALGRGVPVLPIRLSTDPYGFIGKFQAIRGALEDPLSLAENITRTLLRNNQLHGHMRRALVEAFANSDCYRTAQRLKDYVVAIEDFSDEEKDRLRTACSQNSQISGAYGVTAAIYGMFGAPQAVEAKTDDIPF